MVAAAFIIVLVALGFARSLRRHHLAQLTVEQKAAVTDATAADPVWPIIAFILLIIFSLRSPLARLSLDNRIQGEIYLFTAIFLVSIAVSIAQQLRLRHLALPLAYRRSRIVGTAAVHLAFLFMIFALIRYALAYDVAAATATANQPMKPTATSRNRLTHSLPLIRPSACPSMSHRFPWAPFSMLATTPCRGLSLSHRWIIHQIEQR
jgi:hypothetical protein